MNNNENIILVQAGNIEVTVDDLIQYAMSLISTKNTSWLEKQSERRLAELQLAVAIAEDGGNLLECNIEELEVKKEALDAIKNRKFLRPQPVES